MEIIDLGRLPDPPAPPSRLWRALDLIGNFAAVATLTLAPVYCVMAWRVLNAPIPPARIASADVPPRPIPPGPGRGERAALAGLAARIAATDAARTARSQR